MNVLPGTRHVPVCGLLLTFSYPLEESKPLQKVFSFPLQMVFSAMVALYFFHNFFRNLFQSWHFNFFHNLFRNLPTLVRHFVSANLITLRPMYYKTKKSASLSHFDTCFMHNIGRVYDRR